jgi:hypothetical protein
LSTGNLPEYPIFLPILCAAILLSWPQAGLSSSSRYCTALAANLQGPPSKEKAWLYVQQLMAMLAWTVYHIAYYGTSL